MGGDYTYGWGDEDYIVPLTLYKFYGNTDVIESKYAKIKTLINYRKNQVASGDVLPSKGTYTYGDHQAPSKVSDEFFCNVYYTLMYKRAAEGRNFRQRPTKRQAILLNTKKRASLSTTSIILPMKTTTPPRIRAVLCMRLPLSLPSRKTVKHLRQSSMNMLRQAVITLPPASCPPNTF